MVAAPVANSGLGSQLGRVGLVVCDARASHSLRMGVPHRVDKCAAVVAPVHRGTSSPADVVKAAFISASSSRTAAI